MRSNNLFKSQSFIEKAFYGCIIGFVLISSLSIYVVYNHYADIEMYLLRKRLTYMTDDEIRVLWKLNPGLGDRAADLRRPFQEYDAKSYHKDIVFQNPHPRVVAIQSPKTASKSQPPPRKPIDINDDAAILNVSDPPTNTSSLEDESLYFAPDVLTNANKPKKQPTKTQSTQIMQGFQQDPNLIRILSWTPKYSFKKEWFQKRKLAFFTCNLPENKRCEYTTDTDNYDISEVILFRLRLLKHKALPTHRHPKQKWLVFENESPSYVWPVSPNLETTNMKEMFNLTSTYSMDSNIPFRSQLKCSMNTTKYKTLRDANLVAGKTKLVAWFVSNCETPSHREDYVKELSKYIPVDIYGACGNMTCGGQSSQKNNKNVDCYDNLLNNTYKFYLSFENSLCQSYVTEKLWNLYLRKINIIPIVLGYSHYPDMIPKGTFLDVRDYASPQKLAEHLRKLDNDDKLFNKYLRRKASMKCNSPKEPPFKCRLCEYLHKYRERQQIVDDVRTYWSEESKCQSPEEFYKNIADISSATTSLIEKDPMEMLANVEAAQAKIDNAIAVQQLQDGMDNLGAEKFKLPGVTDNFETQKDKHPPVEDVIAPGVGNVQIPSVPEEIDFVEAVENIGHAKTIRFNDFANFETKDNDEDLESEDDNEDIGNLEDIDV